MTTGRLITATASPAATAPTAIAIAIAASILTTAPLASVTLGGSW